MGAGDVEQASYRGRRNPAPAAANLLVGEIDGTVCGTLGWVQDGTVCSIVHVYVEPWARNVGVGDALMDALLREAVRCGAAAVGASALPGDRSLKNLFERNGLVAREILVERVLP
ncbi:MAG: hypothetical protein RLZZ305_1074 [Actinomycetota bacterium]|jgi:ribosomal protein S18 acetylase RimI-like enzyme